MSEEAAEERTRDRLKASILELVAAAEGDGEVATMAAELAADWTRAASTIAQSERVLEILREDLEKALTGRDPAGRVEVLRAEVLDRRLRVLSRRSLALGKRLIDGEPVADARAQGEALMAKARAVSAAVRQLKDPALSRPLTRAAEEVALEALYVIERKAMSRRLAHYAQSVGGGDIGGGPPKIAP